MEKEKKIGKKTLLAWVREILSRNETDLSEITAPSDDVVDRLINKAAGEKVIDNETPGKDSSNDDEEVNNDAEPERKTCAYAMKRNIVASLQEIRRFAEKHDLAATMVRALLTLLAEMAISALRGKVGEKALEALLKALNYQQDLNEAYLRGKNEAIVTEYFPEADDIPHLGGMQREDPDLDNIFTIAREA